MTSRARILIVDDEANARTALAELLRDEGYVTETAADGFKALPKLDEFNPDLLLTNLKMPGLDGMELMRRSREREPERPVIMMTAFGTVADAVAAMRAGATDYLAKPLNIEELAAVIKRALEDRHLREETGRLRERLTERPTFKNLIGSSPAMQRVYDTIVQVAPTRASIVITGESGTGKELVAAAIHERSTRARMPFVKLHCAALTETLLESELFGHERGAFTGAVSRRDGRFTQADGGTLLLDEIGEISLSLQTKLLRFLQQHEFERVGSNQTQKVDVRIIAATHRDLSERIKAGAFREDLFYRLNVVSIEVPPLRARASDIPLLASHFLHHFAQENGSHVTGFSDAALELLVRYPWPGNVRELENTIERAVVTTRTDVVGLDALGPSIEHLASTKGGAPSVPGSSLAELERYAILRTLEDAGGSPSKAARVLGISARKIQYKLREYQGLPRHGQRPGAHQDAVQEMSEPAPLVAAGEEAREAITG